MWLYLSGISKGKNMRTLVFPKGVLDNPIRHICCICEVNVKVISGIMRGRFIVKWFRCDEQILDALVTTRVLF